MSKDKEKILEVLRPSKYGMSVKKIAEQLGWSRTTVSKYLQKLKQNEEVFDRDIGQYKIWLYNRSKGAEDTSKENLLFLKAYQLFLKYLHEYHPELEDAKKIGASIGKDLDIENFISLDINDVIKKPLELSQIAQTFMDILNNIYLLNYEEYKFDPPIINYKPPFIILRIKESDYVEIPMHFELLCGIFEEKINQLLKLNLDISIHDVFKDEKMIDIKIQVKEI